MLKTGFLFVALAAGLALPGAGQLCLWRKILARGPGR